MSVTRAKDTSPQPYVLSLNIPIVDITACIELIIVGEFNFLSKNLAYRRCLTVFDTCRALQ